MKARETRLEIEQPSEQINLKIREIDEEENRKNGYTYLVRRVIT
jgi:hypothetical protein